MRFRYIESKFKLKTLLNARSSLASEIIMSQSIYSTYDFHYKRGQVYASGIKDQVLLVSPVRLEPCYF